MTFYLRLNYTFSSGMLDNWQSSSCRTSPQVIDITKVKKMMLCGKVWASYLHWIVVQIKAESDTLMKSRHWFLCAIDIGHFFRLHIALLVINCSFNNTVPYCLPANNNMSHQYSNKSMTLYTLYNVQLSDTTVISVVHQCATNSFPATCAQNWVTATSALCTRAAHDCIHQPLLAHLPCTLSTLCLGKK